MSLFLFLVSSFALAAAGGPMAPRTVAHPYLPNVELAMDASNCSADTNCVTVVNTGSTFLVPQNSNAPGGMRVVDPEGYTNGIYKDGLPVFVGFTVDPTTGETIPMLNGTFVSAIEPCIRSGSWPTTALRVRTAKEITVTAESVVFYPEPGPVTKAFDVQTGTIIRYHPGYGETVGQVDPIKSVLRNAIGEPTTYAWRIALGNGRCQS